MRRRVAAVVLVHDGAEVTDTPGHVGRETVDGRPLAEHRLEPLRVGVGDRPRLERPEPLFQLERAGEGGLHRHLLVERESDQQRERLARQERIRLGIAREVDRVRRAHEHDRNRRGTADERRRSVR
jgi:hypothetical protein